MPRSRSHQAHDKVLHAAIELFGERGIEAASMDAIARASGVSKATIYNHWADKEALLMEVMNFVHGLDREPEIIDTGDLHADLVTVLSGRPPSHLDAPRNRITPSLIAYSAFHPEFGRAWRQQVTEPSRQAIRRILRRAIRRGQLPRNLPLDTAIAVLLGPMLYVHIFYKENPRRKPEIGPEVAGAFCRAYQIPATRTPTRR
ncbi:MAG TPA: TetR/AcrR family transcriptional regulator [Terracidiphilus sp.]|nr:TetR/AcrR family transcriptional regulator [Terracidiphilus sp.]